MTTTLGRLRASGGFDTIGGGHWQGVTHRPGDTQEGQYRGRAQGTCGPGGRLDVLGAAREGADGCHPTPPDLSNDVKGLSSGSRSK